MKIIVSIGDCNGIGLETFYKAIHILQKNKNLKDIYQFYLTGNKNTIKEYYQKLNFEVRIKKNVISINDIDIEIIELPFYSPVEFGNISESSANLTIESLEFAVKSVVNKKYDAILTLPINKYALQRVGWNFPGHTEFLAKYCNLSDYLMILLAGKIRVALVTTHIPLINVPEVLNQDLIIKKAIIFYQSLLKDFSIKKPKIAVLGLNPHAGENGAIGSEEINLIIPALKKLNQDGQKYFGPFPADGFYAHKEYKNYDGILAMYHDQGLIPLKLLAKNRGVNFTANLPIVRTSPDHGTAFQIAGKGLADGKSTYEAIRLAYFVAKRRNKYQGT